MTQLAFVWPRRFTVPAWFASWVVDGVTYRYAVGAHSVDESWPWWKPWQAFEFGVACPGEHRR